MTGIDAFEELIYCATFSPFTPGISTSRKTTSKRFNGSFNAVINSEPLKNGVILYLIWFLFSTVESFSLIISLKSSSSSQIAISMFILKYILL